MRSFLALIAIVMGVFAAPVRAQETRFFSAFEDLPLPAGLEEQAEANIAFYGAAGRIQMAAARGAMAEDEIFAFYRASLPALGWAAAPGDANAFARGRERLSLGVMRQADGGVVLQVRVLTRPASFAVD
jgi:hypothetical protein